jgi:hypothetical protein
VTMDPFICTILAEISGMPVSPKSSHLVPCLRHRVHVRGSVTPYPPPSDLSDLGGGRGKGNGVNATTGLGLNANSIRLKSLCLADSASPATKRERR